MGKIGLAMNVSKSEDALSEFGPAHEPYLRCGKSTGFAARRNFPS